MIQDKLYDVGLAQRRAMFGSAGAEDVVEHTTDANDKLEEFVTRVCFGDIWQREGLSLADRSKITLSLLLAQGKSHEIRVHMHGALANGVSPLELRELVTHSLLYIGIPGAVEGMRALREVFEKRGISLDIDGEAGRTAAEASA